MTTTASTPQLGRGDLTKMTAAQIVAARKAGQFADLARGIDHGTVGDHAGPDQLTRAELAGLTPAEIVQARREGRLNALLSGSEPDHE